MHIMIGELLKILTPYIILLQIRLLSVIKTTLA